MLKRYFSFFVLFLFLANSVGFSLITLLQLKMHHKFEKWKEGNEKIIDLRITLAEINAPSSTFRWVKDDEFMFNGRMYDVVSSKKENDSFIFKCHDDTKEGALYKKLEEQNAQDENLPGKHKRIALKKGIEYDHAAFNFSCVSHYSSTQHTATVELFAPVVFRAVASPPPWLG